MDLWVEERHRDSQANCFRVEQILFHGKSEFQSVAIVKTASHGRMLLNDGLIMLSERDEFVYHEMIAHVPLLVHPRPRRVLVIGGGDGGTVRECLKHPTVEHIHLVEIDAMVVDACREHIPSCAGRLDDERVQVTITDGVAFVTETSERYDIVLVDSTDPIGPAAPLFGPDFYRHVKRVLTDQGIVVSQCENPWFEQQAQRALLDILGDLFPVISLYNYHNLTYPGGLWSFSFASKGPRPDSKLDQPRIAALGELNWWTPAIHRAAFALPAFQQRTLGLDP
jgi:spermidine synthase